MGRRALSGLTKTLTAVAVVMALAIGGFFGLRSLWHSATTPFTAESCTVGSYTVDPAQAAVASTMVAAVTSYTPQLPERAAILVLAGALQESKLTNIPAGYGDRDSVGVLQQRPSQGWGSVSGKPDSIADRTERLTDVFFATTAFLDRLQDVANWQTLPVADAVQQVQISADGSAYAQHEGEATALAAALSGSSPAGITCTFGAPTVVASATTVAAQLAQQLPVNPPATSGLTVTVPGASWQTAAWFVANADRLGIDQVGYDGQQWTRAGGWTSAATPSTAVTATMAAVK
ncbi:MAG: hypothetical protein ABI232_08275 [Jatrophihabitantaceae bacterium]